MNLRKILQSPASPIQFPFSVTVGRGDGPTVLLTAGMDGDEYAGIFAALDLQKDPGILSFPGTLHIVPIVNVHGFLSGVSSNPNDQLYPKFIFPGNKSGKDSEKIIYSVWERFGKKATLWIDLHGGATHEHLVPFVQGHVTGVPKIDSKTRSLLTALDFNRTIFCPWKKVTDIAKQGCQYILLESGEKGTCEQKNRTQHSVWVKKILDWIVHDNSVQNLREVYHTIHYYTCPSDGLWQPNTIPENLTEGMTIGSLTHFQTRKQELITVQKNGILLYQHVGNFGKKGMTLLAVGENFS